MIEVVFSDSACGCLRAAQHYGGGKYQIGAIGISVRCTDGSQPTRAEMENAQREAEEKERLLWERSTPVGGNPADVYGFPLALSIGNISEHQPGPARQQVLEWLFSIYPECVGQQAAKELMKQTKDNLSAVCSRAAAGEPLRIWYSSNPDDFCGLYWFMDQLRQANGCNDYISLVQLPDWITDDNGNVVRKSGWGEVAPGEWGKYVAFERTASRLFCQSCADDWRTLQKENAPLRAVLNGKLASIPVTIYDDFILREIEAEEAEFNEARVIGKVLGKYQLGIGDAWIAHRIEAMIRNGILKPVNQAPKDSPMYHRRLRKSTGTQTRN